jgi:diguanylate cyclase (GGDEF)-like protein/PAS domain S-box-containing protein
VATSKRQQTEAIESLRELKLNCMDNLLASPEMRVYFKDLQSRFLLVSAGCDATVPAGHALEELIGKTDLDFYSEEHAAEALRDEQEIIRTGKTIEGKLERETFHNRADAWVSTSKMPLLNSRGQIVGTFGITRDVTAQIKAEKALAHQVLHDPVTGLANRLSLMDRIKQALASMERTPGRLAVLFIDLDHFKQVNDTFGHDAGDQVLAEIGHRISRISRRSDTVARLGGDEFVVLCASLHDGDELALIGNRIVEGVRAPYVKDGRDLSVTCSIGIIVTSDSHFDPEELIRDADEAMYEAKASGRDCQRVFDPSKHTASTASRLKTDLTQGIENREFFLLYQPLFSLEDRTLVGVEALVRWRHPERGIVLPDAFIPFAEQHGLIGRIDSFVLDEACRQLAEWTNRDGWPSHFTMAINVSGRELSEISFADFVAEAIRRHALAPQRICLEITETAFVGGWAEIQETLEALSSLGVRIALDDFGTGYSSLAHLQQMKVDVVKIDRSFVEHIGRSERDREIVAAVTAMSHALGISVVGEGVETDDQLATLAGLDCDEGQGFLLARPTSAEAIATLVEGQISLNS